MRPAVVTTRWWWVRHAPVTANKGRVYGQSDMPCEVDNRPAFEALARTLPRDAVWVTSHLQRTHQTAAAIVAAGLPGPDPIPGPDVISETELAEQSFGDWQGMTYTALAEQHGDAYHRFWLAPAHVAPPGGESFDTLITRVRGAIERLSQVHQGRDIIAVTHGGTIRAALAIALDLPSEVALAFNVDNLSLTRLEQFDGAAIGTGHAWRVVGVNLPPR
jgi:broad specificity phosphatase PhoE